MRGRRLFRLTKPFLIVVSAGLRLLPLRVVAFGLLLMRYLPTHIGVAVRYILMRRLSSKCGDCVAIFEGVYLYDMHRARLGDNVSIHPMCYIKATGGLSIGSNVSIAHGTTIMTEEHDFSHPDKPIRDTACIMAPVTIGSDVWIGAGVRILAGVSIGDHVVIGAGAVVTKDVPSHTLAVGVPAKPMKQVKENAYIGSHAFV